MALRNTRQSKIEFVRWFRSTSQNDNKILRIFFIDDGYYAVFGEQHAEYIANDIDGITAYVKQYPPIIDEDADNSQSIPCVYFKQGHKISIIQDYVSIQHKNVEIYTRNKQTGKWTISDKISPSNYSTGFIEEAAFNFISIIMWFKQQVKYLGICLYNHATNKFEIAQYIEDDRYTKISSLFAAKGVKQCIFKCISNNKLYQIEINKFHQILKKNYIKLLDTEKDKFWSFIKNESSYMSIINNIINKTSKKRLLTFNDHKLAFSATCGVILHQELHTNEENIGMFKLTEHQIDCFMRLDNAALTALNLFSTAQNAFLRNNNNSLYGVLSHCLSAMGDRELSIWIRQPLVNIKQIHRRQKLVKLFVENEQVRCTLREEHLKKLVDLEKLSNKLINNRGTLKDLVDLYIFVEVIPFIREELKQVKDVEFMSDNNDYKPINVLINEFMGPIMDMQTNFNNYLAMIEQVVDLNKVPKQYLIQKQFDKQLALFSKQKDEIMRNMEKEKSSSIYDLDVKDKEITLYKNRTSLITNDNKWCLKMKKDTKLNKKVTENTHYIVIPTQKKNLFYFTTKKLKKFSKTFIEIENEYLKRQKIIVSKTIEIAKTYHSVIDEAARIFCELDVILSLAHVAGNSPYTYTLPTVYDIKQKNERFIKMKNARHPCLELIQLEDMGGVIANNVELIDNRSSFQIVTGPNMGGKSTYIRMIGLITLMAQIGSYVPCDECELSIIDAILARVGASDNILRGVSSFMAEMLESNAILEGATNNSLIIIDELGRGTSTYDGYGIAYAISEYIIRHIGSFCLFATHFHELAALASEYDCVVNKHVTAIKNDCENKENDMNDDVLTMEYKIQKGPCPQSFGIEVAKIAKFPGNVIQMANDKVMELESKKNSTISLLTFESLKQILEMYKGVIRKISMNNWNENDKMYQNEIEKVQEFILSKIDNGDDGNEELDNMCIEIQKEIDNANGNNGSDKMEID